MRRIGAVLVEVGLVGAMMATSLGGLRFASAMCASTTKLQVEPRALTPGESLTITGQGFVATCNDQGEGGGCFGGGKRARDKPAKGIEVRIIQDGRATTVATVNADSNYGFRVSVPLPATLHPGPAVVKADAEVPIEVR